MLTESLLIAIVGGALGSLLAFWSFQGIVAYLMSHLPHGTPPLLFNVAPDLRVLVYALVLSVVTGLTFGLIPALQASRSDLNEVLKQEASSAGTRSGGMLRNVLVAAQVAVCMLLLIASGLLMRGLYAAQTIDPGFDIKNVTIASFDLRAQGFTLENAAAFQRRLIQRVAALPGVESIAQAGVIPLSDSHRTSAFSIVAIMSSGLGAIALLLASVGVYGMVSYAVSRRTREMGIRMTLGANASDFMSMTVQRAMRPVVAGAAVGIAGCVAVSQLLSKLLFGVSAHDPLAFTIVPVFLLLVACVASYIPARRASKVDPMEALRYQ